MKKILFLVLATFGVSNAFSQSFMHGAGIGFYFDKVEDLDPRLSFALTYSPRFNFVETEALSVSVGIPVSVGFSGSYNYNNAYGYSEETNTLGFMFHAPVMVNLNFAAGSTKANRSRIGGFVGGGFGYHYSASTDSDYFDENGDPIIVEGSSTGPAANAGMRIRVGGGGKAIEIRMSYFKGITGSKPDLVGLGCTFNF
ncbi:hypothetical protein [Chitinophaga niabensis]|uniref:Outer membrane protein beta-barrel domain-containing protein n=1 Tax=Chitinophaga niabensis TaxID=536979 RepID=A0A1N6FPW2_9BACT|nr:hypothetical protein [Chitinophaga niabensis]SIN97263.1 hypothetical protein SAMN04488055_2342 [Chitinophaga niabensis]